MMKVNPKFMEELQEEAVQMQQDGLLSTEVLLQIALLTLTLEIKTLLERIEQNLEA